MVELRCAVARGRRYGRALKTEAERLLGLSGMADAELSVVLVGDSGVRLLNRDYRGKDCATDVLSFAQLEGTGGTPNGVAVGRPARPHPVAARSRAATRRRGGAAAISPPLPLGDVVISIDTAARQARELAVTPAARLRTLLIHGFLHLLGYDHERSAADARRMFARERALAGRLAGPRSSSAAAKGRPAPTAAPDGRARGRGVRR